MRTRFKPTKQAYCHKCHNWVLAKEVKLIKWRKGPFHGEKIHTFQCLCGKTDEGSIFGRSSKPSRRK